MQTIVYADALRIRRIERISLSLSSSVYLFPSSLRLSTPSCCQNQQQCQSWLIRNVRLSSAPPPQRDAGLLRRSERRQPDGDPSRPSGPGARGARSHEAVAATGACMLHAGRVDVGKDDACPAPLSWKIGKLSRETSSVEETTYLVIDRTLYQCKVCHGVISVLPAHQRRVLGAAGCLDAPCLSPYRAFRPRCQKTFSISSQPLRRALCFPEQLVPFLFCLSCCLSPARGRGTSTSVGWFSESFLQRV